MTITSGWGPSNLYHHSLALLPPSTMKLLLQSPSQVVTCSLSFFPSPAQLPHFSTLLCLFPGHEFMFPSPTLPSSVCLPQALQSQVPCPYSFPSDYVVTPHSMMRTTPSSLSRSWRLNMNSTPRIGMTFRNQVREVLLDLDAGLKGTEALMDLGSVPDMFI